MSGRFHLLPIDDSEASEQALNWYVQNYHQHNDRLMLLHVHHVPKVPPTHPEKSTVKSMSLVKHFEDRCKARNLDYTVVMKDDFQSPGHMIVAVANTNRVDAIVMSRRGLSMIERALLGSTSEYVIRKAEVPVLLIPPKMK